MKTNRILTVLSTVAVGLILQSASCNNSGSSPATGGGDSSVKKTQMAPTAPDTSKTGGLHALYAANPGNIAVDMYCFNKATYTAVSGGGANICIYNAGNASPYSFMLANPTTPPPYNSPLPAPNYGPACYEMMNIGCPNCCDVTSLINALSIPANIKQYSNGDGFNNLIGNFDQLSASTPGSLISAIALNNNALNSYFNNAPLNVTAVIVTVGIYGPPGGNQSAMIVYSFYSGTNQVGAFVDYNPSCFPRENH